MAPVLRLSEIVAAFALAFSLVAVAFSLLLIPRELPRQAAEEVSAREILVGALKIFVCLVVVFLRPVEVSGGGTVATMEASSVPEIMATMVVVVMVMVAIVSVPALMTTFILRPAEVLGVTAATIVLAAIAIVSEQTLGRSEESSAGTSDETSDDTSADSIADFFFEIIYKGHSVFSIVARSARACSMPTPGCLQTGRLRQKQIRPSVTCRTSDPSQLGRKLGCGTHAEAMECCPSQRNSMASKVRLRLTM